MLRRVVGEGVGEGVGEVGGEDEDGLLGERECVGIDCHCCCGCYSILEDSSFAEVQEVLEVLVDSCSCSCSSKEDRSSLAVEDYNSSVVDLNSRSSS